MVNVVYSMHSVTFKKYFGQFLNTQSRIEPMTLELDGQHPFITLCVSIFYRDPSWIPGSSTQAIQVRAVKSTSTPDIIVKMRLQRV